MVVAHRVFDMTVVIITGAGALIFFAGAVDVPHAPVWSAFAAVGLSLGAALLTGILAPRLTYRLLSKAFRSERARGRFRFLGLLTARGSSALLALAWLRYLVYTGQFLLLLFAFAPEAPLALSYAAVDLVMFAKFIIPPVTFSDLGIREGAAVFFFNLINVEGSAAFNAAILMYCINLLLPAGLGLPFIMRLKFTQDKPLTSIPPGDGAGIPHAVEVGAPPARPEPSSLIRSERR